MERESPGWLVTPHEIPSVFTAGARYHFVHTMSAIVEPGPARIRTVLGCYYFWSTLSKTIPREKMRSRARSERMERESRVGQ